jgi:nucleotide-binding universal stress UspA family protein
VRIGGAGFSFLYLAVGLCSARSSVTAAVNPVRSPACPWKGVLERRFSADSRGRFDREAVDMDVIVVGVDGSAESVAALRYALQEAQACDAQVRLVNAWHVPSLAYQAAVLPESFPGDLREEGAATLEEALAECTDLLDGVSVQRVVREGEPGHVLVAEAEGATQLVLGTHGRSTIGEFVLGSVSHYCCRHAHCPVTVIPHIRDSDQQAH